MRRTREQWIQIVEQYQQRKCTQAYFCRENQLSLATFNKWKHRLESESGTEFVTISPDVTGNDSQRSGFQIRLTLGDGVVLELTKS